MSSIFKKNLTLSDEWGQALKTLVIHWIQRLPNSMPGKCD